MDIEQSQGKRRRLTADAQSIGAYGSNRPTEVCAYCAAPLPRLGKPQIAGDVVSCAYTPATRIKTARLFCAADICIWPNRKWRCVAAKVADDRLMASAREGAVAVLFSVADVRGLTVTSMYMELASK